MNTRRFLAPLAFATLLAPTLVPTAAAEGVVLDGAQQKRIDAVFKDYDKPDSPGCSLGVISDGRIIYARGYGMAQLDPAVPIDSTKLFEVASMSKQFTAASIVLLAQQGRIRLTDDVHKYIPELPDYGAPITINNLLWHTSGLRDYTVLLLLGSFDYFEVTTEAQALDFVKRQRKLDFAPGSRYSYSNTGYFLMSLIVKRVTGMSLNDFARQQIFNPLAMPTAVYRDRHDLPIPNRALGYAPNGAGGFDVSISNWEQVGDGGLHVSIEELQKWDENFYHPQVGGPAFVTEMLRRGALNDGRSLTYARGLQVDHYRGLARVRHGGDWVGYHANLERFPEQHTSVALECNLDPIDQYALSKQVIDIVLEKAFTEPAPVDPPPAPSLPAERFVGEYYSKTLQEAFAVVAENGGLVFKILYLSLPMVALGPTTFTLADVPSARLEFAVQGDAKAHALQFRLDRDDPDTSPVQASRFGPVAPADLTPYLGKFYSPELNVTWSIVIDPDGHLAVDDNDPTPVLPVKAPLNPAFADSFYDNAGFLRFTRTASGAVNGFDMSFNGLRDFRFDLQRPPFMTSWTSPDSQYR